MKKSFKEEEEGALRVNLPSLTKTLIAILFSLLQTGSRCKNYTFLLGESKNMQLFLQ